MLEENKNMVMRKEPKESNIAIKENTCEKYNAPHFLIGNIISLAMGIIGGLIIKTFYSDIFKN